MNASLKNWTEHIRIIGIDEFPSFLVTGKTASVLIEAGVSSLVPNILKDIETINPRAPLKYLFAAHAHADHVCGLIRLKCIQPDLCFCGSEQTGRILGKAGVINTFFKEDAAYTNYLSTKGFPLNKEQQVPVEPVVLDGILENHRIIDLGGVYIEAIDVPGHAPGGLAFFIRPDNVALISDSAGYANTATDILPLFFHHFQNTVDSLIKLKSLKPGHVALGHNVHIDGEKYTNRFFDQAISDTQKMKTGILDKMADDTNMDIIESGLAEKMLRFKMFKGFSRKKLIRFSQLLIRRVVES
jgi:2-aminobenzoylacetyl-CoA thioesterase